MARALQCAVDVQGLSHSLRMEKLDGGEMSRARGHPQTGQGPGSVHIVGICWINRCNCGSYIFLNVEHICTEKRLFIQHNRSTNKPQTHIMRKKKSTSRIKFLARSGKVPPRTWLRFPRRLPGGRFVLAGTATRARKRSRGKEIAQVGAPMKPAGRWDPGPEGGAWGRVG